MEGSERDNTQDWVLPAHATPASARELQERVDEALATAKATEAAVMTVGAAAIDAAEEARRAARIAERAAASALDAQDRVGRMTVRQIGPDDDRLRGFSERADRVVRRLRDLERISAPAGDDTPPADQPGR